MGFMMEIPIIPGTTLLTTYDPKKINLQQIATGKKSGFGRGGILTKCQTSEKIASMGIPVHIANGRTENVILRIMKDDEIGTRFPGQESNVQF